MNIYSRNTSDMIRFDFVKFTRRETETLPKVNETPKAEDKVSKALEEYRAQLAKDDGLGSYGSYKCPIF